MSDKIDNLKKPKALFIQRFFAFLIDSIIVIFASSLIASPFVDSSKISSLEDKSIKLMENFRENKVSNKEYLAEYMNISYELAKNEGIVSLVSVFFGLLLFVVVPLYNNGQTIGKKLLKIKIISDKDDLNANQLIFRAFIANSLLINLLSVIILLFSSKNTYFYCYGLCNLIQYFITIISIFMILFRKDRKSVHDLLVKTSVIRIRRLL